MPTGGMPTSGTMAAGLISQNANKCRRSADENLNRSQPMNDAQKLDKAAYGGSPGMTCSASSVPDQCPKCGIERAEGWVHGYRGWKCGTYWQSNSDSTNQLKQSIECAVTHWKKRALKAEWLLSLITPPNVQDQPASPAGNSNEATDSQNGN